MSGCMSWAKGSSLEGGDSGGSFTTPPSFFPQVRYTDDDPGIGETGGAHHESLALSPPQNWSVRQEADIRSQTQEEDPRPDSCLYLVLAEIFDYLTNGKGTNTDNSPGGDPGGKGSDSAQQETKDFDDGANALWSLYENEAKSNDATRYQKLKEDMDGVIIFVRRQVLYSTLYRLSA
jgi:hypothetical protein